MCATPPTFSQNHFKLYRRYFSCCINVNVAFGFMVENFYNFFHLKGNRPIKSSIEFLLKPYTVVECYMVSENNEINNYWFLRVRYAICVPV